MFTFSVSASTRVSANVNVNVGVRARVNFDVSAAAHCKTTSTPRSKTICCANEHVTVCVSCSDTVRSGCLMFVQFGVSAVMYNCHVKCQCWRYGQFAFTFAPVVALLLRSLLARVQAVSKGSATVPVSSGAFEIVIRTRMRYACSRSCMWHCYC